MAGSIDVSLLNNPPDKSEFAVAKYFADLGKDIVFIPPSAIPGQHRPDVFMDGVEWDKWIIRNFYSLTNMNGFIK